MLFLQQTFSVVRSERKTPEEAATRISSKKWSHHELDTISNRPFCSCKYNLVTSPLLLRFDSSRPTFLKTDWSAGGMGYIIMQPDDSPDSLVTTDEFLFDM